MKYYGAIIALLTSSAFSFKMENEAVGILDRAYAKIKQKEDLEEQERTVQFLL